MATTLGRMHSGSESTLGKMHGTPSGTGAGRRSKESKRKRLNALMAGLKSDRQSFEAHWRDLSEYFRPRRARFTLADNARGNKRSEKIIDSTPVFAARTLQAGMMSGVTSPARPWFRLTLPDKQLAEHHDVRRWLDDVRERMASVFIRSNLYNQLPSYYGDMGVFGTAALAIEEDDETTIRATHFAIGEYWLATNAKGQVRTFAREFQMTVRQVVEQFGIFEGDSDVPSEHNLSLQVVNAWKGDRLDEKVTIVHLITENPAHDPKKLDAKFKRYVSLYFENGTGDDKMLQESGYDEFPVMAARWETTPGDVYGTDSPGMTALSDNKALQFGEKLGAQALEKMVKPPMVASVSMTQNPLSLLPGGVSYVDETSDKKFRAAIDTSGFRVDLLGQEQDKVRMRVEKAFFVDLFLLISSSDRREITATEIRVRQEEKLLNLGPVLERINEDLLDPLIDRVFNIMQRRGEIPPPPEALQGMPLRVEYVSVMAQAQKAIGRSGLETFASFGASVAQFRPDVLDKIDTDQMMDEYAEMTGVPVSVIVSDEQVAEVRAARAEVQAKQAATEQAMMESQTARNLAQAPTTGGNALSDLLGQMSAGPMSMQGY